eukprot:TRINITY_DN5060_c0_g1_i1.p1 TRINITY_DN5060_c0_g1~~TRINITY_DN5060_c0_g1_i1.p1  ORF type:complete len:643 (-),score=109.81 TRINITY_DN5060_c0_g1_i1:182-2110(-)
MTVASQRGPNLQPQPPPPPPDSSKPPREQTNRGPAWISIETALQQERHDVLATLQASHEAFLRKLEHDWLELNLGYLEEQMMGNGAHEPFSFVHKLHRSAGLPEPKVEDFDAPNGSEDKVWPREIFIQPASPQEKKRVLGAKSSSLTSSLIPEEEELDMKAMHNRGSEDVACGGRGAEGEHLEASHTTLDQRDEEDDYEMPSLKGLGLQNMYRWVHSTEWELCFGMLIVANTLGMIFEIQYDGWNVGIKLGAPGVEKSGAEAWPSAQEVFDAMDAFFGFIFTFEVAAKIVTERGTFVWSFANWYDLIIVCLHWLKSAMDLDKYFSPFILRLVRVTRLLRLLKFVKTFEAFDTLRLLVRSIKACVSTMVWTGILVFSIIMVFAMFFCLLLLDTLRDESLEADVRVQLFELFGTFDRGILSIHEVTFGNWVPISNFMASNLYRYYAFFFMTYRCVISFGILLVVRSVFVAETIRVASTDDEIMILQKERQVRANRQRMDRFFAEADENGNGEVNLDEFRQILQKKRVQQLLHAQDLWISDPRFVFQLAGKTEEESMTSQELAEGLARLRGVARSIDLTALIIGVSKMEKKLGDLHEHVFHLTGAVATHLPGAVESMRLSAYVGARCHDPFAETGDGPSVASVAA